MKKVFVIKDILTDEFYCVPATQKISDGVYTTGDIVDMKNQNTHATTSLKNPFQKP